MNYVCSSNWSSSSLLTEPAKMASMQPPACQRRISHRDSVGGGLDDPVSDAARLTARTAQGSIPLGLLASMVLRSFAASKNLESNRSGFTDRKSHPGAACRQIRSAQKTGNQLYKKIYLLGKSPPGKCLEQDGAWGIVTKLADSMHRSDR